MGRPVKAEAWSRQNVSRSTRSNKQNRPLERVSGESSMLRISTPSLIIAGTSIEVCRTVTAGRLPDSSFELL